MKMCTMLRYTSALLIVMSIWEVSYELNTEDEGPFQLIVHNTTDCLVKQHSWFKTNITVYESKGQSLLRGTVVSTRPVKSAKFRMTCYYADNGHMLKVFDIKNQNCYNVIVKLVLATIKVPVDEKKCSMKPVKTEFNNLNLKSVVTSIVRSMWYGNALIRWEVLIPDMKIMCLEINLTSARVNQTKL